MSREADRPGAPSQVPHLGVYAAHLAGSLDIVRGWIPKHRVSAADIDDLVQDIALQAWQSIQCGNYQPADPLDYKKFKDWLYGVAWRTVSHYRETSWRKRTRLTSEPYERTGEPCVPSHEGRIAAREMLRALDRLPAWARDVLIYYYLEELDCPTIAIIIDKIEATTTTRLRLARAHFLKAVKRWRKP